jgi:hypothetical protein
MRQVAGIINSRLSILPLMLLSILLTNATTGWSQDRNSKEQKAQAEFVRQQAFSALEAILSESKNYDDQALRARLGAQVADVLWPSNPDRARDLIIGAFDDAITVKVDLSKRYSLRREIIAVARRHNPELAAKLIARLDDKSDESRDRLSRDSLERISERGAHYIDSARSLLEAGDQNRAISFARRSFAEGRSSELIWFLYNLRERDRTAADKLFLEALNVLRTGGADPNDVLFFGLYLFYPGRVAAGDLSDGIVAVSYGLNFSAAPDAQTALVRPYLQAAAEALLRFQVIPGQPGPNGSMALKRFALLQLLPLFQRYEPKLFGEISTQLTALGSYEAPTDNSKEEETPNISDPSTSETIKNIEKLNSPKERNHYFFTAAKQAVDMGDFERAKALASRLEIGDLKRATIELIGFNEARTSIKRGELDEAAKIASTKLSQERSAVIYAQLASAWLERSNYARANEEASDAVAAATRTEDRAQRARVHIYLASGWVKRDALRAFEFIEAAVKDINAAEQFDSTDDQITFKIETPLAVQTFVLSQGVGLLSDVSQLAAVDFLRTLYLARELRPAAPRALSIIAACRVALSANGHTSIPGNTPSFKQTPEL